MFACVSLWAPHTCCAHRGQKGASDPLELESWKGSGEWIRFSSSSLSLEASPVLGFFSPKVPSSGYPVGGTVSLKSGAGRPSHDGAGTAPFGGWARAACVSAAATQGSKAALLATGLGDDKATAWPVTRVRAHLSHRPQHREGPQLCSTVAFSSPPAAPLTLASGDHSGEL